MPGGERSSSQLDYLDIDSTMKLVHSLAPAVANSTSGAPAWAAMKTGTWPIARKGPLRRPSPRRCPARPAPTSLARTLLAGTFFAWLRNRPGDRSALDFRRNA